MAFALNSSVSLDFGVLLSQNTGMSFNISNSLDLLKKGTARPQVMPCFLSLKAAVVGLGRKLPPVREIGAKCVITENIMPEVRALPSGGFPANDPNDAVSQASSNALKGITCGFKPALASLPAQIFSKPFAYFWKYLKTVTWNAAGGALCSPLFQDQLKQWGDVVVGQVPGLKTYASGKSLADAHAKSSYDGFIGKNQLTWIPQGTYREEIGTTKNYYFNEGSHWSYPLACGIMVGLCGCVFLHSIMAKLTSHSRRACCSCTASTKKKCGTTPCNKNS